MSMETKAMAEMTKVVWAMEIPIWMGISATIH